MRWYICKKIHSPTKIFVRLLSPLLTLIFNALRFESVKKVLCLPRYLTHSNLRALKKSFI